MTTKHFIMELEILLQESGIFIYLNKLIKIFDGGRNPSGHSNSVRCLLIVVRANSRKQIRARNL